MKPGPSRDVRSWTATRDWLATGITILFGFIDAGPAWQGLATILEIVWEIGILGLYLIFRGFQPAVLQRFSPDPGQGQLDAGQMERSAIDQYSSIRPLRPTCVAFREVTERHDAAVSGPHTGAAFHAQDLGGRAARNPCVDFRPHRSP